MSDELARAICALHEARHLRGTACGAVLLGMSKPDYEELAVSVWVALSGGECCLELPDRASAALTHTYSQMSQLSALAPLAGVAASDLVDMVKHGDEASLIAAGDLSAADVALVRAWDGAPMLPLRAVLAVAQLESKLGDKGVAEQNALLTDASLLALGPVRLDDFVPYAEAVQAVRRATEQLDAILNPRPVLRDSAPAAARIQAMR